MAPVAYSQGLAQSFPAAACIGKRQCQKGDEKTAKWGHTFCAPLQVLVNSSH